ncbi:uncharacterized protein GGS25DRAFT_464435 [Hypoxylon fragiforme]|uniref:uncharacterized protein n=1 Tax=Hypoxylon fragiforme TaxID=63214 RepID=UPI0020C63296|nr:uncharacterized protein GGS25DRAFT_464435 [Hypoxylon fragiforme]KAI2604522.1 hypothetical protein GGS25DRAFT_464435 [Hypoxylon fragiforme]
MYLPVVGHDPLTYILPILTLTTIIPNETKRTAHMHFFEGIASMRYYPWMKVVYLRFIVPCLPYMVAIAN